MFWSAALDLKTQQPPRPLSRASYGSFHRTGSTFRIPQSIPEHHPVSQFTSPLPVDSRRLEEYFERPETAFARTKASLQLSEQTQTALKLLLQRDGNTLPLNWTQGTKVRQCTPDTRQLHGHSARRTSLKQLPERTPLLKPLQPSCAYSNEAFTPEEKNYEHNYWMQELARRRAGMRKSRRRTCTPMTERGTTSPFKVGLVMCSVPLVLVLGFIFFVVVFGEGLDEPNNVKNVVNNLLGFDTGEKDDVYSMATRHDVVEDNKARIAKTFALPPEIVQLEKKESPVLMLLSMSTGQIRLRGTQKENVGE